MKASVIYTTDGSCHKGLANECLIRIKEASEKQGYELIVMKQNPKKERSHKSLYVNLLAGLCKAKYKMVYIVEHDCIYPDDYFEPMKKRPNLSYSKDCLFLTCEGYRPRYMAALSSLAGDKDIITKAIKSKLEEAKRGKTDRTEPGFGDQFSKLMSLRALKTPYLDVRHGENFTGRRLTDVIFTFDKFWGDFEVHWKRIFRESPLSVTCIITNKNEPLLCWTVRNIQKTAPRAEIIVVHDGFCKKESLSKEIKQITPWNTSQGIGPCRDLGAMEASGDYVIFLDAHMDFKQGWIPRMIQSAKDIDISCSMSLVLRPDNRNMKHASKLNKGAGMAYIEANKIPFEPIWKKHKPLDEIQCVLGACYCIKKQRYIDILRPWKNAIGWGTSEQVISSVNWFLGGTSVLADCESGHVYRDGGYEAPYKVGDIQKNGMAYNRLRLVDLLPITSSEKKRLSAIVKNRNKGRDWAIVEEWLNNKDDSEIKRAIKESPRTWDEYIDKWYPEGIPAIKKDVNTDIKINKSNDPRVDLGFNRGGRIEHVR